MEAPDPEAENRWRAHVANPFWVLELSTGASALEAERQGAKLLAMIAAAIPGADRYETPFGPQPRSADAVRQSLAEIRDPDRRAVHEWWARGVEE
jgi:hypothetical protein